MGKAQQHKGRSGELELVKILNEQGIDARAGLPVSFGTSPDVTGVKNIHVEVKRHEHLNLSQAMEQSIQDSHKFNDGMPAVFHRKNHQPWLVTMLLSDWIRLYKGAYEEEIQ